MSRQVEIPVIETERLRLRGHGVDDFDDLCAIWADPDVVRHIGGEPVKPEDVWSKLLRMTGHWTLFGFGYWRIEDRDSGRHVGQAGFGIQMRDIDPPFGDAPEIGWALRSDARGRGLAIEAVRAVIAWGEEHFGDVETVCLIHPENVRSIHLAEKVGYREYARTTYRGGPAILMRRGGGAAGSAG